MAVFQSVMNVANRSTLFSQAMSSTSISCTSYMVTMLPYLKCKFVVGNWKFCQTAHPGAAVEGAAGLQKVRALFAFALISWV